MEEIQREHPKTFQIPDAEERRNLQPGDFVQLMFLIEGDGPDERMWAIVREVTRTGYIGMLDNVPFTLEENDALWVGTEFAFTYHHLMDCRPANKKSLATIKKPPPIPWTKG